ncbi:MAG: hypothetical protein AB4038_09465 [Prochloraceae cyanobacterium]
MLAYELEHDFEYEFEDDDYESDYESEEFLGALLPAIAPIAIKALGGLFQESEFEFEQDDDFEYEEEAELEAMPASPDESMMHQLAQMAARSESEAEAEAFLGAIAGLAAKALPGIAKKVIPTLTRGAFRLGRSLFRNPQARRLLRTAPTIMQGAVQDLSRRAAQGQPINSRAVMRTLARRTARTFRSPRRTRWAMQRSRRINRYPYRRPYRPSNRRRRYYAY